MSRVLDSTVAATARPIWFGPAGRPLAGWLHTPVSGRARAGVVLCPPLGIEAICTYFTYRRLADQLAAAGLAVVRFDYDGTGDSAGGPDEPERVDAWRASTAAAVDVLTGAGLESVALAGIRMGAMFAAAEAARRGGVEALILWDPCLSGGEFLREQLIYGMVGLGSVEERPPGAGGPSAAGQVTDDGAIEIPGMRFDPATVADMQAFKLVDAGPAGAARRLLVLQDPDKRPLRRLARHLEGSGCEWGSADGQTALLDPPLQEPPEATMARVTAWLDEVFAGHAEVELTEPEPTDRALVGAGAVSERFVRIGALGLFGVLTEGTTVPGAPAVVFVSEGNTPHIGQSRMWVEMARELAGRGFRVLRWDLSGNGDSPTRPGQQAHQVRASEHFDDVAEAVRFASPDDPGNVFLLGLCSGAYQAAESALSTELRGIGLINPAFLFPAPEWPLNERRQARQSTRPWLVRVLRGPVGTAARRRSADAAERWIDALEKSTWLSSLARRYPNVPDPVWALATRATTRRRTAMVLEEAVATGIDILMVCGPEDLYPIEIGSARTMARLAKRPNFTLAALRDLDHAVLIVDQRALVMRTVANWLTRRYLPG